MNNMLSTGYTALDTALGGGYPRGRLVEMYGPESGGKTTLALRAIAAHQRTESIATTAFFDMRAAFDSDRAAALGVTTERMIVNQPANVDDAFKSINVCVRSCAFDLIVVDGLEEPPAYGVLRSLVPSLHRIRTTLLITTREPACTPSMKFYTALRLDVRAIGHNVSRVTVVKNTAARPFVKTEIGLYGA